jgi:KaiC/GvpD/RAD55 family RecA-like ATPase
MPLTMPIPGLSNFIKEVPDGSLIHVEGGIDSVKSAFAIQLAGSAAERGWLAVMASTRWLPDLRSEVEYAFPKGTFEILSVKDSSSLAGHTAPKTVFVADSFSYLSLEMSPAALKTSLESLRGVCKNTGCIAILVTDAGTMGLERESIVTQVCDGVVQFLSRESQERYARFIRIPKWVGGVSLGENLYYDYDGRRINIDLRARVV